MSFLNFKSISIKINAETQRSVLMDKLSNASFKGSLRAEQIIEGHKVVYILRSANLHEQLQGFFGLRSKENNAAKSKVNDVLNFLKEKKGFENINLPTQIINREEDGAMLNPTVQSIRVDELLTALKTPKNSKIIWSEKLLQAFTDSPLNMAFHSASLVVAAHAFVIAPSNNNNSPKPASSESSDIFGRKLHYFHEDNLPSEVDYIKNTDDSYRETATKNFYNNMSCARGTVVVEILPSYLSTGKDGKKKKEYVDQDMKKILDTILENISNNKNIEVTIAIDDRDLFDRINSLMQGTGNNFSQSVIDIKTARAQNAY